MLTFLFFSIQIQSINFSEKNNNIIQKFNILNIDVHIPKAQDIVDTDGDGLSDQSEVEDYNTDPKDPDSDNDNLNDYTEVMIYFTNPNNNDSDNDILDDYSELLVHFTDPNDNDTDDDLLTDYDEIFIYSTDPTNIDSDNDNLNDFDEINTYSTNPNNKDSDEDGFIDGDEVLFGTDPNSALNNVFINMTIIFLIIAILSVISCFIVLYLKKKMDIKDKFPTELESIQIKTLDRQKGNVRREKEQIEKIKKMMEVSTRIPLDMMQDALSLDKSTFHKKIFDWAHQFNFTIDGITLVINKKEKISDFINELKMSQSIYKSIMNSSQDLYVLIRNNRIIECNDAIQNFSLLKKGQILENNIFDLFNDQDFIEHYNIFLNQIVNSTNGDTSYSFEFKRESRIKTQWFHVILMQLVVKELILMICRNITPIKVRINEFKRRDKDYAEIIHDIKNYVHIIHGRSESIVKKEQIYRNKLKSLMDAKEYDEFLRSFYYINKAALNLSLTFHNFQYMKKKEKVALEKQDIASIMDEAKNLIQFLANKKDIKINFEKPSEKIYILANHVLLLISFLNIIGNSIKYTQSFGKIMLKLERNDNLVIVKIRDNGYGFINNEIKSLFKKNKEGNYVYKTFNREGIESIERKGTGIGLVSTKSIIENHNGEFIIESEGKFRGTTVIFKFHFLETLNKNN